jgi:hypothetical protein
LYGCEIWSVTLREEYGVKVFEKRALRKIFGSRREEVTGEWRRLRNEQHYALLLSKCYSDDHIKKNGMIKACATYGEIRDACNVWMGVV